MDLCLERSFCDIMRRGEKKADKVLWKYICITYAHSYAKTQVECRTFWDLALPNVGSLS